MNELRQTYTDRGLLQQYKKGDKEAGIETGDFARAKVYAQAFVRRYPQAIAEIQKEGEIIELVRDDEYWAWFNEHKKEWESVRHKGENISKLFALFLVVVVVLCLTTISHFMGVYGFSYLAKISVVPLLAIVFWRILSIVLAGKT